MKYSTKKSSYTMFALVVVLVTLAPVVLNIAGFNFGSQERDSLHGLKVKPAIASAVLHGNIVHTILEWSAVSAALFTAILALVNYYVNRDGVVMIIASAMLCGGLMDGFHALCAVHLIPLSIDAVNIGPFTWMAARIFFCLILIVGVAIVLLDRSGRIRNSQRVIFSAMCLMGAASGLVIFMTTSFDVLPATMFPGSFFKRPFDLVALVMFLTVIPVLLRKLFREFPGMFAFSLLISMVPQAAAQAYLVLGSGTLFDNSFHMAHLLKVVAYLVPLAGICLHYVQNLQHERNAVELLVQTQKLAFLGQLSSGAAHEINNPLTAVRGLTEVLEHKARSNRLTNEDVIRISQAIGQNSDRIVRIIQSLKMVAGESRGSGSQTILVKDLFEHVLDLTRERAGKFGIIISAGDVPDQKSVIGEGSELVQLLLNLVQNALDAVEHTGNGRIQLAAYCNLNSQIEISIEDNGPGIGSEHRKALFTPFFTTRDVGLGAGLGLSTSLAIARKYRGELVFERFSPGVKVVLKLPIAEATTNGVHSLQRLAG